MALEPQKAPRNKEKAASEEREQHSTHTLQELHSEVEEAPTRRTKTNQKAKSAARAQHIAQPDVAAEEPAPAQTLKPVAPGAEENVGKRRIAPEFTLVLTEAAHEALKDKPAEYVRAVTDEANARMYWAEAVVCGVFEVITIGRVGPLASFDKWWSPFRVGKQWFVVRYRDAFIREYELQPADGPAPDGGPSPLIRRRQKTPPPTNIAPRARRNRNDRKGVRTAADAPSRQHEAAPKRGKKEKNAKRVAIELLERATWDLEVLRHNLDHRWRLLDRTLSPRLLSSVERMKRSGGNIVRHLRVVVAPLVQAARRSLAIAKNTHHAFTTSRAKARATFGPEARLEGRCAGNNTGLHLILNSWIWTETSPVDWSQWLFGVDWSANIFGVPEEEQAFT